MIRKLEFFAILLSTDYLFYVAWRYGCNRKILRGEFYSQDMKMASEQDTNQCSLVLASSKIFYMLELLVLDCARHSIPIKSKKKFKLVWELIFR